MILIKIWNNVEILGADCGDVVYSYEEKLVIPFSEDTIVNYKVENNGRVFNLATEDDNDIMIHYFLVYYEPSVIDSLRNQYEYPLPVK